MNIFKKIAFCNIKDYYVLSYLYDECLGKKILLDIVIFICYISGFLEKHKALYKWIWTCIT
jgi:hypothetical protein